MANDAEVQGSDEWKARRCGRITMSRAGDVMARSKRDGKPLQAYYDYMAELVCERLTGKAQGIPMTAAMQWGVECEPHARAAYEAAKGVIVDQTGFTVHPKLPFVGASPDGLIGDDGVTEIKSPFNSIYHMETWIHGMPEEHIPQVQGNIWVHGRKWADFNSFDPRMPEKMRLYVQRIPRDDAYISKLEAACIELDRQVNEMIERLLKAVDN